MSTPESTALDLVRYAPSAGGIDNVVAVLSEMAEGIEPDRPAEATGIGPVMDEVHRALDSWLGKPRWKQGPGRVALYCQTACCPCDQRPSPAPARAAKRSNRPGSRADTSGVELEGLT
ncbi:MAG: hypothetical protein IPK72_17745 [Candidatus Eisenbacteria bacterium]|nr:hypothetical protein [Candidatus Eisenbacteria bacterium]